MENLIGKFEAFLSEKEIQVTDDLIFLINTLINPPLQVKKEDIYVRAMYLVSDQVNSFGGCFPVSEHSKLAQLLVDSPVIVGHSKERLPIARNFKADQINKNEINWIKTYFYWLKNSSDAESLKHNIDYGIYKECSIGYTFEFPECSICTLDMRRCPHIPFRTYEKETGEKMQAYYNYRNIIKVHETSLVYRGAIIGTSITNELELFQKHDCTDGICKYKRAYKESVFESLKKAGLEKNAKLTGEILENGYTDDKIHIFCDKNSEQKVLSSLPQILRDRISFVKEKIQFKSCRFILQKPIQKTTDYFIIRFENGTNQSSLYLYRFNLKKLSKRRRFLCDFSEEIVDKDIQDSEVEILDKGKCKKEKETTSLISLRFEGKALTGNFILKKINLKNKKHWLFYIE